MDPVWLFSLCFMCWFSTVTGIECRRDVEFIVESHLNLCKLTSGCNYCWGQFFHDFVQPIDDIGALNVNMHVFHSNGLVYGCELALTHAQTCECTSNKWNYNGMNIPSLLRIAQDGFRTMRAGFSDTIMLVVASPIDNAEEVARYLHSHRVQVVVIAVGDRVDRDQLMKIATDEYSLFMLRDNDHLLQSIYDIRKAVCRACKKDVTFALAWHNASSAPANWGWCAGGMISEFVNPLDDEIRVTSVDWGMDTVVRGCAADWKDFSSQCACLESRWPTLTTSTFYEHIVKKFFDFRQIYQNVIVLFADRKLGFQTHDMTSFQDNSVLVVTVEVGDQLEDKELEQLASSSNVSYTIDSWDDVHQLIPTLRHFVCFDEALQPAFKDCGDRTDLTLLVDLSRSMTGHVVEMKTFLTSLIENLNISRDHHHVSFVTFSSGAKVLLQDSHDVTSVHDVIGGLAPERGPSNIADALLQAAILTRNSSRIMSDSGEHCPRASVLILSDGLYDDKRNPLARVRTLNQMGVKVSFVSFGHEETVYMSEAMVSPGLQVHEFESNWNSSSFDDLKEELTNGIPPENPKVNETDCFYSPRAVIFLFYVEVQDAIVTTLKEFAGFVSSSESIPDIYIIYPGYLLPFPLPFNASFIPTHATTLAAYIDEAMEIKVTSDEQTTYIIAADDINEVPTPIFQEIRRLQEQGSKVMTLGTAAKVNHNVLERIASIPRYALSSQSTWDLQIPAKMWTRYCDACGFTKPIDIAIYVETSTEICNMWKSVTNFLLTASASFPVGKKNVQISVTTFGEQTYNDIHFYSYTDKLDLFRQIYDLKAKDEPINITSVLIDVQTAFSVSRGARPEAVKVLVLILDSELVGSVDDSNDIQTIWFDISGRKTFDFKSKYLDSSDTYVKTDGVEDLMTYQNELHDMICRAIYVE